MYNIVIVEDEPIELESLQRIISQCVDNAVLHEAPTGKKAIELIDELQQIDMMFVDINIPLPNGREVIEYLKSKNQETKVVVTTANDDFDIVRSMLSLRVEDYLLKPVKKTMLTDTIKKTLGFDDQEMAASRAQKQTIADLLDNHRYTEWHQFLFNTLDTAYEGSRSGKETSLEVKNLLDNVILYLENAGEKFSASRSKLTLLSQDVERYGLSESLYARLLFALMKVSRERFESAFKQTHSNHDFLERAKFHIERGLLDTITLDDIAEKSYVSSCYLSRAFKKSEGIGFSNYVTKRKIDIARALLKYSDLKVNTIALELAWQDSNYFCRIFKKETGMAPSDFRQLENASIH